MAPDLVVEDRRRTGTGRIEGRDAYVRTVIALWELAPDARLEAGWDWLATAPEIVAYRARRTGRIPDGGGEFESEFIVIVAHENGKTIRMEVFEPDDEAEALARFETLRSARVMPTEPRATAERRTGTAPLPAAPIRRETAASRAMARWDAAFRIAFETDDWTMIRENCGPGFMFEDRQRRSLVTGDVEILVASLRERVRAGATYARPDIGCVGDRILINRVRWAGGPPGGEFEIEYFGTVETDEAGLLRRMVLFDIDDQDAVRQDAWARWVAIDPAVAPFVQALGEYVPGWNAKDIDRLRAMFAEDLVVDDRRRTGTGRLDGREAYLRSVEAVWELAPESTFDGGWDWLATSANAAVYRGRRTGRIPDGGEFESDFLIVAVVEDGKTRRVEIFEADDEAKALARFEALRSEAARPFRRSELMARGFRTIWAAWEAQRLDDIRALVAPSFRYEDRGKRALVEGDVGTWIESMRFWPPGTRVRADEIIAVWGDRITLDRAGWSGSTDGAAFEIERIRLIEIDADGRVVAAIHFDVDDLSEAFGEAERRFLEGEAAGCEGQAVITEAVRPAFGELWSHFREALAPDLVHHDHRVLGMGSLDREGWIDSLRALADVADGLHHEWSSVLAWSRHGRVGRMRQYGMVMDGGPFENEFVNLMMVRDGCIDRIEVFDVGDANEAVRRFAALSAEQDGSA